jgi:heptosyltransferase-3
VSGAATTKLELPARPRILVITLRRLGDVLLTTPIIRSIKRTWPDGAIDVLAYEATGGILSGNPDIARVIGIPEPPGAAQDLALMARLWKRYDLAVSTQPGDRPTRYALIAGRKSVAPVQDRFTGRIKAALLTRSVPFSGSVHRVEEVLRLADALGIARVPEIVGPAVPASRGTQRYAVIHAKPMYRYKQWTADGWRAVAAALAQRGLKLKATGGPDAAERAYLDTLWNGSPQIERLDGTLSWPELFALISRAEIFIGPDTSVTHLAAASGCPTIALYGPTDPRLWGPWPAQGLHQEWQAAGTMQRRGNVWLVQNPLPCMPCQKEGCERDRDHGRSICLEEMRPEDVINAIDAALAAPGAK